MPAFRSDRPNRRYHPYPRPVEFDSNVIALSIIFGLALIKFFRTQCKNVIFSGTSCNASVIGSPLSLLDLAGNTKKKSSTNHHYDLVGFFFPSVCLPSLTSPTQKNLCPRTKRSIANTDMDLQSLCFALVTESVDTLFFASIKCDFLEGNLQSLKLLRNDIESRLMYRASINNEM
ncbi:hypothetical protein GG344DRAFT_72912 [Lentinula edodes]|nr:hypothetical protein GG344DRAFT_72912 [Lentinula edodes]